MGQQAQAQRLDGRGYPMPRDGWTCFHCGETFDTWGGARDHFGETQCSTPACQIKLGNERGLVMELRKFEKQASENLERAFDAERDLEATQCQVSSLSDAMHGYKPFRECNSIYEVFCLFDSMEGRALAAEERVNALEALLNTPEVEDFDKAVPLEAAHQIQRWGVAADAGKNPEDWFWLCGYLAGKALAAFKAGDMIKAKHHCVSTSAAMRNWHAHIRSGESFMRPGISEDKAAIV